MKVEVMLLDSTLLHSSGKLSVKADACDAPVFELISLVFALT